MAQPRVVFPNGSVGTMPQQPMDLALRAYWQAPSAERGARREEAREMLRHVPVETPQYVAWIQNVSSMYQNAGRTVDARAIILEALRRTDDLDKSHPARSQLLVALANSWRADGNLLQAAADFEQAGDIAVFGSQLAELYQQMGRPDAAAAVSERIKTELQDHPAALASYYEQHGQIDEAIATYKRILDQAEDPRAKVWPMQSLARLYASQKRYDDAVAAMQQAIAGASPPAATGLRHNLAGILQQAGRLDEADQIYQQLVADASHTDAGSGYGSMLNYASYLSATNRPAQGEAVLKGYLASHSDAPPAVAFGVYNQLANLARQAGDNDGAEEYRKIAAAKQSALMPMPAAGTVSISDVTQRARAALDHGNIEDAFTLLLQAINSSDSVRDRSLLMYQIPDLLSKMAAKKEPARAEQLFQRLFAAAEMWTDTREQTLAELWARYVQFLTEQPDRYGEIPAAIWRYRDGLIAAHGPDTNAAELPLRLTINFERYHGSKAKAVQAGEELLATEESLSGNSSEPYLGVVEQVADLYDAAGDTDHALAFRRRAVAICDRALSEKDQRRANIRVEMARALARAGQFDEADRVAAEAASLPGANDYIRRRVAEIKRMRTAASK